MKKSDYRRKLEEWADDGYDVSDLQRRWFFTRTGWRWNPKLTLGIAAAGVLAIVLGILIPGWLTSGSNAGEPGPGTSQGNEAVGLPSTSPTLTTPAITRSIVSTTTVTTTIQTIPTTTAIKIATITATSEPAPTTSVVATTAITTMPSTTTTASPQPTAVPTVNVVGEIPGTPLSLGVKQSSVVDKNLKPRDVYALKLTAGQEVQLQVDSQSVLTVELAEPGSTSFETGNVALAINEQTYDFYSKLFGGGTSWTSNFDPPVTGIYYLAIIAEDSAESYTVQVLLTGQ